MSEDNDVADRLLDWNQKRLWDKLAHDIRFAINGQWSIAAESTTRDIVWIARVRGVTHPDAISIPMLASGVYHAVCRLVPTKAYVDFDLDNYIEHWGDYRELMRAIPDIDQLTIEEFKEGLED